MMKELESDEPFEVSVGCPTITFDLTDESLMLPWSSFGSGVFKDSRIELRFQEWRVEIEGRCLGEIWRLLQTQDVRCIMPSSGAGAGVEHACKIQNITATKVVAE